MLTDTKLRIHKTNLKARLRYGSELWTKKRKEQKLGGSTNALFRRVRKIAKSNY
jgi:hypothetical protein